MSIQEGSQPDVQGDLEPHTWKKQWVECKVWQGLEAAKTMKNKYKCLKTHKMNSCVSLLNKYNL